MFAIASILSLVTLIISVPIFLVFGLGSSLAAIAGLNLPWSVLIQVSFGALTKHVLIAVPLFIFTGMAMLKGGAASRLVKFTTTLVGHWPGGLGVAMVIAMGFFAAFCGSILAAITAVGTIVNLIALISACVFFKAGVDATTMYYNLGQMMELEINIPIWWMFLAFPVGFLILALTSLELILDNFKKLLGKE